MPKERRAKLIYDWDWLCLKSQIYKGATVGVALRGHPFQE